MRSLAWVLTVALLGVGATGCGKAGTRSSAHVPSATGTSATVSATAPAGATGAGRPLQSDNYISTYGHKASAIERRMITALVEHYYALALAGDGATACSLLYAPLAKAVPRDYGTVGGRLERRGRTCGVVLPNLFKHVPEHPTADLASTRVTGARLAGNGGFAQLSSKAMPTGEIFIEREGRQWRLGALVGRTCANCSAH